MFHVKFVDHAIDRYGIIIVAVLTEIFQLSNNIPAILSGNEVALARKLSLLSREPKSLRIA